MALPAPVMQLHQHRYLMITQVFCNMYVLNMQVMHFSPIKKLTVLTMAAVGSGTTIDHVQVTYAKDDAFEWFGGTCKLQIPDRLQNTG